MQGPERSALIERQPALGRSEATCAALIPIRKSAAWWELIQDERRAIFEERSHHITTGLDYLPAIARRLYRSRDLGEPFDFLTWFEYAPSSAGLFQDLWASSARLKCGLMWSGKSTFASRWRIDRASRRANPNHAASIPLGELAGVRIHFCPPTAPVEATFHERVVKPPDAGV